MKIVNLSYSDQFGGASRSAYNIHKSLLSAKLNSKMIVIKKFTNDNKIIKYENNISKYIQKIKNYFSIIISRIFFGGNASFNFFSNKNLVKLVNKEKPAIVLIHWIHAEMLSIEDINKIKSKKIFVLHDMWWLKDCEHYFDEKYNNKNFMNPSFKNFINLSYLTALRKKKIKISNLVTPSNWLYICSKKFIKTKNLNIKKIKYALDVKKFRPLKIKKKEKKIKLLFVGFGKVDEKRKGIDLLVKVLNNLNNFNIELLIIGEIDKEKFKDLNIDIKFLKRVNSDYKLNKLYNYSDILLFTSRQDNLPNVVLEAQSAGLPVVSFNTGGLKDIIRNNYNGYLCKSFDQNDFAKKVIKLINNKSLRLKFSINSRKYALKNLNYKKIGKEYLYYFKKGLN
tara:strand:- start:369 stop:1553 length:1185 start_codon:yes stop_codon:yes gene_type:complete